MTTSVKTLCSLCLLFLFTLPVQAQPKAPEAQAPKLEGLTHEISGELLYVDFTTTHDANIEFSLFTKAGEALWRTQFLKHRGGQRIKVRLTSIKDGGDFSYHLKYKGREYSRDFSL